MIVTGLLKLVTLFLRCVLFWDLCWEVYNRFKNKRDIEVKNNLTIARGEWGRDSGEIGFQELL